MNEYFKIAIKASKKALNNNEIPVGAVIVKNNKIIAVAKNNRQRTHNILGHAEINCILKASKKLKDWRLDDCTMYVTLEPCEMCNIIIKNSRIKNVYYLLEKDKENLIINNNIVKAENCETLENEYNLILKNFFSKLRK